MLKFFIVPFCYLGNHWDSRAYFVKQAGRFYPLDIDYGQVWNWSELRFFQRIAKLCFQEPSTDNE